MAQYKYLLYGGAMGGGKSYFLRWACIRWLHHLFKKYKKKGIIAGLFCENYPALRDRHLLKIKYEFPNWLGKYNNSTKEFTLTNKWGAGVLAFRNLDEPAKYKSAEFAIIAVDEIVQDPKEVFDFLRTRLRWPGIPECRFIAGSNPGGIGHDWVKKLWIDKIYEYGEVEQKEFHFIPATAYDNPYLDQTYYNSLEGLPPDMKRAFLEGDWSIFAGQYFSEWRSSKHIVPTFYIPDTWKKYRVYDHGRSKPACCLWIAIDYEGRVWIYREYYVVNKNIDTIAEEIKSMSGDEKYVLNLADPSIFAHMGYTDKVGNDTIAQVFARHGITFFPGSKRRVDGWNLMHQYLAPDERGVPKLIFLKNCENAVRTIPSLVHDKIKPEDIDTKGEDHAADCIRYFLLHLRERKGPPPDNSIEAQLAKLKKVDNPMSDFYKGTFYRRDFGK